MIEDCPSPRLKQHTGKPGAAFAKRRGKSWRTASKTEKRAALRLGFPPLNPPNPGAR
jgi:hypothetical protein